MRIGLALVTVFVSISAAMASQIREFDIPTLERLGNELSRRDEIAARASDLVLDTQPAARVLKLRGWISQLSKDGDKVHLITEVPSGAVLAYTVIFRDDKPTVEDRRGQPLEGPIALRFRARNTAELAVQNKLFDDASYNFEVLDDPDGSGFLVYALAATTKKGEILTGGHYRITVSADGSQAESVDLLSPLIRRHVDPQSKMSAIVRTQLSGNIPVETWLYSSHLYHLPVFVGTKNHTFWKIVNGKMHRFSEAEMALVKKAAKKK